MMDRRRKVLSQVGFKSLELVDEGEGEQLRYGLVERGSGVRREIRLSEIELLWLCLILEDASVGYDKELVRSYGGFVRRVQVRRSVFVGGFSLRVEVRVRERMWFVILPELGGAGGWVDISRKFWAFCGWRRSDGALDGRSFLKVASIDGWPSNNVVVEKEGQRRKGCDIEVRAESTEKSMCFLGRCLVGRLENGAVKLPAAMEVQRWAQRSWKVTAGVQVFDLGGFSFLFALPSVEEAQRVVKGQWGFEGRRMNLEWWSPTVCCTKKGDDCSEVWVKILGLPLQLWDVEVFSAIGNFCGGFQTAFSSSVGKNCCSCLTGEYSADSEDCDGRLDVRSSFMG